MMLTYDVYLDNPATGRFVARFTSQELSKWLCRPHVKEGYNDRLRMDTVDPGERSGAGQTFAPPMRLALALTREEITFEEFRRAYRNRPTPRRSGR